MKPVKTVRGVMTTCTKAACGRIGRHVADRLAVSSAGRRRIERQRVVRAAAREPVLPVPKVWLSRTRLAAAAVARVIEFDLPSSSPGGGKRDVVGVGLAVPSAVDHAGRNRRSERDEAEQRHQRNRKEDEHGALLFRRRNCVCCGECSSFFLPGCVSWTRNRIVRLRAVAASVGQRHDLRVVAATDDYRRFSWWRPVVPPNWRSAGRSDGSTPSGLSTAWSSDRSVRLSVPARCASARLLALLGRHLDGDGPRNLGLVLLLVRHSGRRRSHGCSAGS